MSDTPTMQLVTETVAELPKMERGERSGQYADLIRPAAADREPKRSVFPVGTSKEDAESFRKALTHSANTMGLGCSSILKSVNAAGEIVNDGADGSRLAIYWQIKDKRVRVAGSGQSTPDPVAGADGTGNGTPTKAAKK